MSGSGPRPTVSLLTACFNNAGHLDEAVASALAQRDVTIEVIVVDDGSCDDSLAVAHRLAVADARVRVDRTSANGGPAAARNRALGLARGEWVAVLDADDRMHPDRLARLLTHASEARAGVVADDLMLFGEGLTPTTHLDGRTAGHIDLATYLRGTVLHGRRPNLGFLKPVIRRDVLERHDLRYDERLRIAEDDDLLVRLLLAGARLSVLAQPLYFYRKHAQSISHRLGVVEAERMVAAGQRLEPAVLARADPVARRAWRARRRSIERGAGFAALIDELKARRWGAAVGRVAERPTLLPLLRMPLGAALRRLRPHRAPQPPDPQALPIVSRQRLVGATNGSSAYLLALARSAAAAGWRPQLVQPSPDLFGRSPVLRLSPDMAVFSHHHVRRGHRLGGWLVTSDPRVWARSARGLAQRLARRLGRATAETKAPYAVAQPWTTADRLFVARHVPPSTRRMLLDYAFTAEARPYALAPDAKVAIVMHDLFHARHALFQASGTADSVARLTEAEETRLLASADAVLAIQREEAQWVAAHCPHTVVVLAPMSVDPVAAPRPGNPDRLLFVGSDTAPNLSGLRWLFAEVWPRLHAARPTLRLDVVGRAGPALDGVPPGVTVRGLVDDLAPWYADAGLVLSPLHEGSGLKIKLVEALAEGKACVVTSVTLQGIAELVGDAVALADDPAEFADAVLRLAGNEAARADLAVRALATATRCFGAEAGHRDFREWLGRL